MHYAHHDPQIYFLGRKVLTVHPWNFILEGYYVLLNYGRIKYYKASGSQETVGYTGAYRTYKRSRFKASWVNRVPNTKEERASAFLTFKFHVENMKVRKSEIIEGH